MIRFSLVSIFFALSINAEAFQVTPKFESKRLSVLTKGVEYPANLGKQLTSGLTTKVLFRLSLKEGEKVLETRIVEYSIIYDLWDEIFTLRATGLGPDATSQIRSKPEAIKALSSPVFKGVFGVSERDSGSYHVMVEILLNPINKEKMKEIQKWVAKNSVVNTLDTSVGRSPRATPRSADSVFNAIFEQFSKGNSVAGVWRGKSNSAKFKVRELKLEK